MITSSVLSVTKCLVVQREHALTLEKPARLLCSVGSLIAVSTLAILDNVSVCGLVRGTKTVHKTQTLPLLVTDKLVRCRSVYKQVASLDYNVCIKRPPTSSVTHSPTWSEMHVSLTIPPRRLSLVSLVCAPRISVVNPLIFVFLLRPDLMDFVSQSVRMTVIARKSIQTRRACPVKMVVVMAFVAGDVQRRRIVHLVIHAAMVFVVRDQAELLSEDLCDKL